jgi:hypothetical protein
VKILRTAGISIVGGGYIGEIPAHGIAKIKIKVDPDTITLSLA